MAGYVLFAGLTLSSRRSFSTSISSPMLTNSFLANCIVGIAMTSVRSQFGNTYCNSFIKRFGQMWADISSRSFSIWWVPKMRVLFRGWTLEHRVVSKSIDRLMSVHSSFWRTCVILYESKSSACDEGTGRSCRLQLHQRTAALTYNSNLDIVMKHSPWRGEVDNDS